MFQVVSSIMIFILHGHRHFGVLFLEFQSSITIFTWNVGNILRPAFVTIISVPSWWNSSHSGFASKAAPAPTSAGWRGRFAPNSSAEDAPSSLGWWSPWWRLLLLLSLRDSVADGEIGFTTWTGKATFIGFGLRDRFTLPALCKQAERKTKNDLAQV